MVTVDPPKAPLILPPRVSVCVVVVEDSSVRL